MKSQSTEINKQLPVLLQSVKKLQFDSQFFSKCRDFIAKSPQSPSSAKALNVASVKLLAALQQVLKSQDVVLSMELLKLMDQLLYVIYTTMKYSSYDSEDIYKLNYQVLKVVVERVPDESLWRLEQKMLQDFISRINSDLDQSTEDKENQNVKSPFVITNTSIDLNLKMSIYLLVIKAQYTAGQDQDILKFWQSLSQGLISIFESFHECRDRYATSFVQLLLKSARRSNNLSVLDYIPVLKSVSRLSSLSQNGILVKAVLQILCHLFQQCPAKLAERKLNDISSLFEDFLLLVDNETGQDSEFVQMLISAYNSYCLKVTFDQLDSLAKVLQKSSLTSYLKLLMSLLIDSHKFCAKSTPKYLKSGTFALQQLQSLSLDRVIDQEAVLLCLQSSLRCLDKRGCSDAKACRDFIITLVDLVGDTQSKHVVLSYLILIKFAEIGVVQTRWNRIIDIFKYFNLLEKLSDALYNQFVVCVRGLKEADAQQFLSLSILSICEIGQSLSSQQEQKLLKHYVLMSKQVSDQQEDLTDSFTQLYIKASSILASQDNLVALIETYLLNDIVSMSIDNKCDQVLRLEVVLCYLLGVQKEYAVSICEHMINLQRLDVCWGMYQPVLDNDSEGYLALKESLLLEDPEDPTDLLLANALLVRCKLPDDHQPNTVAFSIDVLRKIESFTLQYLLARNLFNACLSAGLIEQSLSCLQIMKELKSSDFIAMQVWWLNLKNRFLDRQCLEYRTSSVHLLSLKSLTAIMDGDLDASDSAYNEAGLIYEALPSKSKYLAQVFCLMFKSFASFYIGLLGAAMDECKSAMQLIRSMLQHPVIVEHWIKVTDLTYLQYGLCEVYLWRCFLLVTIGSNLEAEYHLGKCLELCKSFQFTALSTICDYMLQLLLIQCGKSQNELILGELRLMQFHAPLPIQQRMVQYLSNLRSDSNQCDLVSQQLQDYHNSLRSNLLLFNYLRVHSSLFLLKLPAKVKLNNDSLICQEKIYLEWFQLKKDLQKSRYNNGTKRFGLVFSDTQIGTKTDLDVQILHVFKQAFMICEPDEIQNLGFEMLQSMLYLHESNEISWQSIFEIMHFMTGISYWRMKFQQICSRLKKDASPLQWPQLDSAASLDLTSGDQASLRLFQSYQEMKSFGVNIPAGWVVLSCVYDSGHSVLYISCWMGPQNSFLFHRQIKPDVMKNIQDQYREVMTANDRLNSSGKTMTSKQDKMLWWDKREQLDLKLKDLLCQVQEQLFGCLSGVIRRAADSDIPQLKKFNVQLTSLFAKFEISLISGEGFNLISRLCFQMQDDIDDFILDDLLHLVQAMLPANSIKVFSSQKKMSMFKQQLRSILPPRQMEFCPSHEHVVLILDKYLLQLPIESMPMFRQQSVSRVISMRHLQDLLEISRDFDKWSLSPSDSAMLCQNPKSAYVLNPSGDLKATEERLNPILSSSSDLNRLAHLSDHSIEECLRDNHLYMYFGHGNGDSFYKSQALTHVTQSAVALLFGCSSARLKDYRCFDPYGSVVDFIMANSPLVVGNLWDVTDKELDKLSVQILLRAGILKNSDIKGTYFESLQMEENCLVVSITQAVALSRDQVRLPHLTGASMICYGIPVKFTH
ncbi:hypothetical protein MP228_000646 [Amoeboaphelidium protococcarum]|nr:hypothetical protein MP228_000646 [Amoeboaphelidium protococcarum]